MVGNINNSFTQQPLYTSTFRPGEQSNGELNNQQNQSTNNTSQINNVNANQQANGAQNVNQVLQAGQSEELNVQNNFARENVRPLSESQQEAPPRRGSALDISI